MEILAWIGFSQAVFAGILIAAKKGNSISDKVLASWLFLMAIEFGTYAIDLKLFKENVTLSNPFFLFNPALYLYVCSLTSKKFTLRPIHLLHLLPYIFFEGTAYLLGVKLRLELFFQVNPTLWFRISFLIATFISWSIYTLISIYRVHLHRINLKNVFSTLDSYKRISWLLFVLVFYILYCMATITSGVLNYFLFTEQIIQAVNYSILLGFMYILGFYGLKQELIFTETEAEDQESNKKYKHSRLNERYKKEIRKNILSFFEEKKPFLDSELTIGKLSESLNVSRHALTEVLNTVFKKNFFQFVNEYRVEAVKKMLADPQYDLLSIEAIGYECGFNSKSTFFSVFKSLTGKTPSQFKEE